jgi:asparaginyl-tRNA synthetase
MRVREEVVKACRDYMYDNGFVLFDSPIFTPNAAEGTTTLFSSDYFDLVKFTSLKLVVICRNRVMAFGRFMISDLPSRQKNPKP